MLYKHILIQHGICICMYVCIIFPQLLKMYQINKNGINVVLYLFLIIENILK